MVSHNKFLYLLLALSLTITSSNSLFASKKSSSSKDKSNTSAPKYFVSFDEAEYHTSPDKRIGAKMLVDSANIGPTIAALTHLTYLPGAHVPTHRHTYSTEVLYVLSGALTVRIGEETQVIRENGSVYIPAGAYHEYLNETTDIVKFLQFYSPSAPEEEYRRWDKPNAPVVQEPKQEQKLEHITTPSMPIVPGSPKAKTDNVIPAQPTKLEILRERLRESLENSQK